MTPKELKDFKTKKQIVEKVKVLGNPYNNPFDNVAYHFENRKKTIYKQLTKAPQNFAYIEVKENEK